MSSNGGKLGLSILLIVVVIVCSALASVNFPNWKPPADWLLAWTSLVVSVVGIAVAVKAFWAGGEAAKEYALKMKRERLIAEAK